MTSLFTFIGTWFGYVGSCVVAPDATCRPFLAFILMGAAACTALVLVILAYRSAQTRETAEVEEHRDRARTRATRERLQRALAARSPAPPAQVNRRYRPA